MGQLNKQTRIIKAQETVLTDLHEFMSDCLADIFDTVEKNQKDIVSTALENKKPMSKIDRANPFKLYNSFISINRPLQIFFDSKEMTE